MPLARQGANGNNRRKAALEDIKAILKLQTHLWQIGEKFPFYNKKWIDPKLNQSNSHVVEQVEEQSDDARRRAFHRVEYGIRTNFRCFGAGKIYGSFCLAEF